MTEYDELRTAPLWDNPALNRLLESATVDAMRKPITGADLVAGDLFREPSGCSDCGVFLFDGDMCGHCERTHVRRAIERHGANSGVCGNCATEAATLAARTGGDVGHLYDDVLRRKAGLPAPCDKAGALDVELCDEPAKPRPVDEWESQFPDAGPYLGAGGWALPEQWGDGTPDWTLSTGKAIDAAMTRHPAGSKPRDVDEELDTIKAVRLSIACLLAYPRGPGSAALLHAFDRRLEQLQAAAIAKRGGQ
ncbi:hypothetical protein ACH47B_06625 [Rhodococcus sp. NPDC019627]|uniref:hypothetical protein n=1 Tax=unclassified Rhodococcus (in: high G+C Gram-positive bacteria) TaxID=192944 RepID=UPI00379A4506